MTPSLRARLWAWLTTPSPAPDTSHLMPFDEWYLLREANHRQLMREAHDARWGKTP